MFKVNIYAFHDYDIFIPPILESDFAEVHKAYECVWLKREVNKYTCISTKYFEEKKEVIFHSNIYEKSHIGHPISNNVTHTDLI